MFKRGFVAAAAFGAMLAAQSGAFGMPVSLGEPGTVTGPAVVGTNYTSGLPSWILNTLAAPTLVAAMTDDWGGTATSNVYFLNNVDGTGGLGFSYRFAVTSTVPPAGALVRTSFNPDWTGVSFLDVGSDASGTSTPATGSPSWTDGDPYSIRRDITGGVAVSFRVDDPNTSTTLGTGINAGQQTALFWWETDATDFRISSVALIDSGVNGDVAVYAVNAVPLPGAALLGLVGLGGVGWVRKRMK